MCVKKTNSLYAVQPPRPTQNMVNVGKTETWTDLGKFFTVVLSYTTPLLFPAGGGGVVDEESLYSSLSLSQIVSQIS